MPKLTKISIPNTAAVLILILAITGFLFLTNYQETLPNIDFSSILGWLKKPLSTATTETNGQVVYKIVNEESQVIETVKKVSPAVVSIITSAEVPVYEKCYRSNPFFDDPFFNDFFDFQIPSQCQKGTEKKRIGAGTGFIVSSSGYIVTNKHVVSNEDAEYTVILNDEKYKDEKVTAQVLARDPINDIAVLKIDKNDLPAVEMGDSDNIQVGQTAIAIGYALGEFDNTVSKGVVSGLARSIDATDYGIGQTEHLEGIVQTDAAVNPGNSGGPLLNISGQAIGMNVAIAQGSENIGFALPINQVKKVYNSVRENGLIEYPFLGVRYLLINKEIQEKNHLKYDYGALIVRGESSSDLAITPGSTADKAGLMENDIILELGGIKIDSKNSLSKLILKYKVGETVALKISHKGEEKEISVVLGKRE